MYVQTPVNGSYLLRQTAGTSGSTKPCIMPMVRGLYRTIRVQWPHAWSLNVLELKAGHLWPHVCINSLAIFSRSSAPSEVHFWETNSRTKKTIRIVADCFSY